MRCVRNCCWDEIICAHFSICLCCLCKMSRGNIERIYWQIAVEHFHLISQYEWVRYFAAWMPGLLTVHISCPGRLVRWTSSMWNYLVNICVHWPIAYTTRYIRCTKWTHIFYGRYALGSLVHRKCLSIAIASCACSERLVLHINFHFRPTIQALATEWLDANQLPPHYLLGIVETNKMNIAKAILWILLVADADLFIRRHRMRPCGVIVHIIECNKGELHHYD